MDEQVMVVDEQNHPVGSAPRSEMRAANQIHRAVYILVFNSKGALFRHQRTETKDIYPGYFDVAAGGVVLAGETYEAAAIRELEEEMGIRDVPLEFLFDFFFDNPESRVFGRVYRCVFDGEIVLQAEEIAGGEFMSLKAVFITADRLRYTPDGWVALKRYLEIQSRDNEKHP